VTTKDGSNERDACDPNGPLAAYVFKTLSDPYVGHITMFRVFSGSVKPDSSVHNERAGADERVGQLFTLRGKEHEPVPSVPAGDIGGVAKLTKTHTGDTLSDKSHPVTIDVPPLPEPLLAYAIEPKTKGDEDKLSTGLARLREEDPTLRVERSDETHETVLFGMGDSHLEVAIARLRDKYGVDVVTRPARIPYKETIRRAVEVTGRHVKQSGGHGQYAVCSIKVDPLPHGAGFEYVDKIVGGAIPHQFIPSVEKGIRKTMTEGVVAGYPMVDLRVTLVDGKSHTVDSSDMAFQVAGSIALKEAVGAAGAVLLEPIVDLEVVVPEEFTGDVMGDLNGKRGKIQGMEQAGGGKQRIRALVPQAEVARYVIDLRSMTGGRGAFGMTFSHYEELPSNLAQKVIAAFQERREAAHKR
jgi:elongation factor G